MNTEIEIMALATEKERSNDKWIQNIPINGGFDRTHAEKSGETVEEATPEVPLAPKRAPRVHINAGGKHFEIARALLVRYPRTRLGRLACLLEGASDPSPDELLDFCDDYRLHQKVSQGATPGHSADNSENDDCPTLYFERDGIALPMLLNFYRNGKLHVTDEMCVINFAEELKYWGIKSVSASLLY